MAGLLLDDLQFRCKYFIHYIYFWKDNKLPTCTIPVVTCVEVSIITDEMDVSLFLEVKLVNACTVEGVLCVTAADDTPLVIMFIKSADVDSRIDTYVELIACVFVTVAVLADSPENNEKMMFEKKAEYTTRDNGL